MTENSKKKSKWWLWGIAIVLVFYIIGRFSAGNEDRTPGDTKMISDRNIANAIFPLKSVAGKSRKDVEKILGVGKFEKNWVDKRAKCTNCPKYLYKGDSLEIIYIDGKADRITINNLGEYSFDPSFITRLGLSPAKPESANENAMSWFGHENFREIMAFNDGKGNINYAMIKTKAD